MPIYKLERAHPSCVLYVGTCRKPERPPPTPHEHNYLSPTVCLTPSPTTLANGSSTTSMDLFTWGEVSCGDEFLTEYFVTVCVGLFWLYLTFCEEDLLTRDTREA